jgi:4-amino-4-deoxychorismate lyase
VFLETLLCENGVLHHAGYHQQRLNATLTHRNSSHSYDLKKLILPPIEGVYRCRFLYDAYGYEIQFYPYVPKRINSLNIIHADTIDYPFKYSDRHQLNALYEQRGECDDVLIIRNGTLTDTTIANIALYDGINWLTPEKPLLEGTTRARLIDEGFLIPAPLRLEDIAHAQKIAVLNALMGFVEVENGIIIQK